MVSSRVSNKRRVCRKPKNMYYHFCYTPMAELRCNYKTLLSWLKPVVPKACSDEICKKSVLNSSAPDLSGLPRTRYRVPSSFIDKILDSLDMRDGALESADHL